MQEQQHSELSHNKLRAIVNTYFITCIGDQQVREFVDMLIYRASNQEEMMYIKDMIETLQQHFLQNPQNFVRTTYGIIKLFRVIDARRELRRLIHICHTDFVKSRKATKIAATISKQDVNQKEND